jgi:acetyltransferase
MNRKGINAFLQARKVAVLGASENNPFSVSLARNLAAFDFPKDDLYLVNPRRKEVLGRSCWPSLADVPGAIDLAVLLVSRERVPEALRSCLEKKVSAAVIVASGFAERDARGRELQEEIRQLGAAGLEIIGPNSMGFVLPSRNLMAWCSALPEHLVPGNVSAVFHSSGMLNLFLQQCSERGIGIRQGWAPGNEITLGLLDCLDYAVADQATGVIALVLEHPGERKAFSRLLDRARENGKPVVVLRLGKSANALRAVQAHTGRLGTPSRAWTAFVRQKGAIPVDTLDELIENCVFLSHLAGSSSRPASRGLGLMTISGGDCSLLVDLCEAIGLELPEPSEKTRETLSRAMEKPLSLVNPLDVEDLWSARPESFKDVVREFAGDAEFGIVACRFNLPKNPTPSFIEMYESTAGAVRSAGKTPIFLTRASEQLRDEWFRFFARLSVPFLLEYGKSLRVIRNYLDRESRLRTGETALKSAFPAGKAPARTASFDRAGREGRKALSHSEAKALFEAYGIRFAPDGVARSEAEALEIASTVGYPVALKVLSPDLPHKTEAGGVALKLASGEELSAAYRDLQKRIRTMSRPVRLEGALVQSMISGGTEVVAGIFQDPLLGPAVLVGLGGIYTEILGDVSIRVPPFSYEEAEAMIQELKGSPILTGARGRPVCDTGALARVIVALGEIALDFEDRLASVDLNPVMVMPQGQGAIAVDVFAPLKE